MALRAAIALSLNVQLVAGQCVSNTAVCTSDPVFNDCCAPYLNPLEAMTCQPGYTAKATGETCGLHPGSAYVCCPGNESTAGTCLGADVTALDKLYHDGACNAQNCEAGKSIWCGPCKNVLKNRWSTDFWATDVDGWCDNNPCFAKETTTACKLNDLSTTPEAAFNACYKTARSLHPQAERVLMASLVAGDTVLTATMAGALTTTTVLVNQHASADDRSTMLTLDTSDGTRLSVTPQHGLFVDAALMAAAGAKVGSSLTLASGNTVSITRISEGPAVPVINPVTASGTILASDHGAPVLAASHPAWLAPLVVKSLLARSAVNAAVLVVGDVTDATDFTVILLAKVGAAAAVAAVTAKVLRLLSVNMAAK